MSLERAERAREDVLGAIGDRPAASGKVCVAAVTGDTITAAAAAGASEMKPIGRITSTSAAIASAPQTPPGRCTASTCGPRSVT